MYIMYYKFYAEHYLSLQCCRKPIQEYLAFVSRHAFIGCVYMFPNLHFMHSSQLWGLEELWVGGIHCLFWVKYVQARSVERKWRWARTVSSAEAPHRFLVGRICCAKWVQAQEYGESGDRMDLRNGYLFFCSCTHLAQPTFTRNPWEPLQRREDRLFSSMGLLRIPSFCLNFKGWKSNFYVINNSFIMYRLILIYAQILKTILKHLVLWAALLKCWLQLYS